MCVLILTTPILLALVVYFLFEWPEIIASLAEVGPWVCIGLAVLSLCMKRLLLSGLLIIIAIGINSCNDMLLADWECDVAYGCSLGPYQAAKKDALYWYEKSAKRGDAYAQLMVASMYHSGDDSCGIEKDRAKAIYWYKKSAQQGNLDAQRELKELGESW